MPRNSSESQVVRQVGHALHVDQSLGRLDGMDIFFHSLLSSRLKRAKPVVALLQVAAAHLQQHPSIDLRVMSPGWKHLGAACLVGLGAVSTVMASCEIPLASGECLQGTRNSMPQSLLQHRARETAAGKLKVGGDKRRNESIHYVPVPQTWQNYVALDAQNLYMDLTNVVQNNLGGKGPNTSAAAAEEIRYQNIFPTLTTGSVDLVVTALTLYQPKKPGNNGNIGEVGSINFRGGKSTTFLFKFVDTFNHSKNVTLEKLFFSYYDIDNDRKELREEISTPYFEKVYLANDTTIEVIPRSGSTPPIFRSTAVDFTGFNNPDDPSNLTPEQKQHAVTFSFLMVSEFEVTFATPNGTWKSGRNFFFSGVPVFADCVNETASAAMTITDVVYSNIGGNGPDTFAPEGMRLKEVFEFENGKLVDLIVKTIDGAGFEYVPRKPEKNGARDGFGSINMELGAKAKFSFEFVDSVTNASVTMKDLFFSWFDLDGHPHEDLTDFQEKIIMGGPLGAFDGVWVTNDTEVNITTLPDGSTEFASTEVDASGGKTNPTDPGVLTPEQENRAFSVKFYSVSTFNVIIDLSSGNRKMPRSLYFHGASRLNNDENPEYCV